MTRSKTSHTIPQWSTQWPSSLHWRLIAVARLLLCGATGCALSPSDLSPELKGDCEDNSSFRDSAGYSCADWKGYDCNRAVEDYGQSDGYDQDDEEEILENCPQTCRVECNRNDDDDNDEDDDGNDANECRDTTGFRDSAGYRCNDWVGYDCQRAVEDYGSSDGYRQANEDELVANCRQSCDLCDDDNEDNDNDDDDDDNNNDENSDTSLGNLEIYYGYLHAHTSVSDGRGTPADAYRAARNEGLDFFGISDHGYDISSSEWRTIKNAANDYNRSGSFVTFWGYEWTSSNRGHITVVNSSSFCPTTSRTCRGMTGFTNWLDDQSNAVAFFNHPGDYGNNWGGFNPTYYTDKIVGMELWNRSNNYYRLDGYYDDALERGWYVGAAGGQDNHSRTWGSANEWRIAVLASNHTRSAILAGLQARRFYSTRDRNLRVSFSCEDEQMGSRISGGNVVCSVEAQDGSRNISKIQMIRNGNRLQTWNPGSRNPIVSHSFNASRDDYVYAVVYLSGSSGWRAVTSPVFITN